MVSATSKLHVDAPFSRKEGAVILHSEAREAGITLRKASML